MKISIEDVSKLGFRFDIFSVNNIENILSNCAAYCEKNYDGKLNASNFNEAILNTSLDLNTCCNCKTIARTTDLHWSEDITNKTIIKNMTTHKKDALCDDCLELFSQKNLPQEKISSFVLNETHLVYEYIRFIGDIKFKAINAEKFSTFCKEKHNIDDYINTFGYAKKFETFLDDNNFIHLFQSNKYNNLLILRLTEYIESLDQDLEKLHKIEDNEGLHCCDKAEKDTLENVSLALGIIISKYQN